jgi:uncharacterized protein YbjT (DUF2867 family)
MDPHGHLFLTGATGHTGSRLARRLLDEGWRLRCLNHNPDHASHLPQSRALEVVRGDLEQPAAWVDALRGAFAFINMAHMGFGSRIVQACESAGVGRVISISSTRRFTKFPEETARRVIAGEAALEASSLQWTILRCSMIYGGDRDNNMEKLTTWLRRHRWFPLVKGGRNLVQPIFTWDVVDAIVRTLQRPEATARKALTLAGPKAMTQRELVEAVARALDRPLVWLPVPFGAALAAAGLLELAMKRPLVTRDQIRRTLENKVFDIDPARAALGGWEPKDFEEGLRLKLAGQV